MILERLTNPSLALDVVECNMIEAWSQRVPRTRNPENSLNGHLTFAHQAAGVLPVVGSVEVDRIDEGLMLRYTSKNDELFSGIWSLYEKPPLQTESFNSFVLSDALPGQFNLFINDTEVVNCLGGYSLECAIDQALANLCGRLDERIERVLR